MGIIPQRFCSLLKLKIGRLVGKKILDHNLVSHQFWVTWPNKLKQKGHYDAAKGRKRRLQIADNDGDSDFPEVLRKIFISLINKINLSLIHI